MPHDDIAIGGHCLVIVGDRVHAERITPVVLDDAIVVGLGAVCVGDPSATTEVPRLEEAIIKNSAHEPNDLPHGVTLDATKEAVNQHGATCWGASVNVAIER